MVASGCNGSDKWVLGFIWVLASVFVWVIGFRLGIMFEFELAVVSICGSIGLLSGDRWLRERKKESKRKRDKN